jgi:uncharacterized membrane protein
MKLLHIILTSIVFLLLDSVYLYTFSDFYNTMVDTIQATRIKFRLSGAIGCYILLIAGLYYFILNKRRSVQDAFLLGILIYGVYETTNYTILTKWSPKAVLLDTLWGGILFALTTHITYTYILQRA